MWDLSILQVVPHLRIAVPRDAATLRAELREAIDVDDAPTVLRYPKGIVGPDIVAVDRVGGVDVLHRTASIADGAATPDVLIVAVGAMARTCLEIGSRLADQGISVTVIDPRWVKPVPTEVVALATTHRLVVTVEDNGRTGGVGSCVTAALQDAGVDTPVLVFGIPQQFLEHAKRGAILSRIGLNAQDISRAVVEAVARLDAAAADPAQAEADQ